jgi:type I restriction enzyme S subunit
MQLPVGWIKTKLGDVCTKVEYGSSAKSKPEGEIPVLRMGNIRNGVIDWNDLVYTTDQEEIDKYLLKYNDILFNRTNSAEHVGKTAIYKGERPAIFAGYLIRIHYKENLIDADFLNYYLNSNTVREYGKSVMSRSVNQANINGTKLKDYPILLPPLPEQKRIVAILDEAFEGIDRAIANTEKNLANSRELFESYLNAIFTQKGNGWEEKKLGDVCEKVEYGSSAKSLPEGAIPVLRMGNIQNGAIDWSNLVYTVDKEEINKYLLRYNDVLFNRTNSEEHVGKTAIYKGKMPAIFADYLIKIHRKEELIDADFLNFYLNSYTAREYGKSIMSRSVNQANINGTKLKGYPLSLPSLSRQKQIVENLSFLRTETQRLEAMYRKKLAALNELKQSILQKAFTGELTADTPKTVKEELAA